MSKAVSNAVEQRNRWRAVHGKFKEFSSSFGRNAPERVEGAQTGLGWLRFRDRPPTSPPLPDAHPSTPRAPRVLPQLRV